MCVLKREINGIVTLTISFVSIWRSPKKFVSYHLKRSFLYEMRSNIIFIPLNLGIQKTSSVSPGCWKRSHYLQMKKTTLKDISCCNRSYIIYGSKLITNNYSLRNNLLEFKSTYHRKTNNIKKKNRLKSISKLRVIWRVKWKQTKIGLEVSDKNGFI